MSQPQNFDPTNPPVGQRRCPKCGLPMVPAQIEPTERVFEDQRTFECVRCAYAETIVVQLS